jgi:hypothetical protein
LLGTIEIASPDFGVCHRLLSPLLAKVLVGLDWFLNRQFGLLDVIVDQPLTCGLRKVEFLEEGVDLSFDFAIKAKAIGDFPVLVSFGCPGRRSDFITCPTAVI